MKTPDNLSGHCAIVTGATGGIGMNFCRELARRHCDLVITDINGDKLVDARNALSADFPDIRIFIVALDLTDQDVTDRMEAFCALERINPDILVNNAGIFSFAPVAETPDRKVECFIQLHVTAVTMLSRWFASRRKEERSGWILNMSSMSCWMPMPGLAMYAATKAYIRVFSRSLHYEMKDYGVNVTVACPGGIATDLFGLPANLKKLAVGIKVLDSPENFARKAIGRMLRGKKQYINGWLNRISIVCVGIAPTPVRMMVKHRLLDKGIIR